jgi:K+-sensing histidine kinase KdpD
VGRRIETSTGTGLTLEGNQHWLALAVSNLVSNALRYGEGTIRVVATEGSGRTRLTISDDGPGFPPDFVDQAFDRFTRAEASRSTRGAGLGLALVQAVAEAHGGTAAITGPQVALDLPTRTADVAVLRPRDRVEDVRPAASRRPVGLDEPLGAEGEREQRDR